MTLTFVFVMTVKTRMNWHRHDYAECEAGGKPVQTGTPVFIRELKSRHFSKADDIVKHVRGQQLTLQYLQTNGFEVPVIIDGKDGLDMTVPPANFSVYDVESYIGNRSNSVKWIGSTCLTIFSYFQAEIEKWTS